MAGLPPSRPDDAAIPQRRSSVEELEARVPPGWLELARQVWEFGPECPARATGAGVREGALYLEMDDSGLSPQAHDELALDVAEARFLSRLTCAGCGSRQVPLGGSGPVLCGECTAAVVDIGGDLEDLFAHRRKLLAQVNANAISPAEQRTDSDVVNPGEQIPGEAAAVAAVAAVRPAGREKTVTEVAPSNGPEACGPTEPGDVRTAREWYVALRQAIRAEVVGHDLAVDSLCAIAALWRTGHRRPPARVTLLGEPGIGKSTLLRSLASALGCPFALVNVAAMAETNWHGADVASQVEALPEGDEDGAQGGVILLDELDAVCTRDTAPGSVTRDYLVGKQRSLLPILGGERVSFRAGVLGSTIAYECANWLVCAAGVFRGAPRDRAVTSEDLVGLGLLPEFVDRLGHLITLEPPDADRLATVLARILPALEAQYAAFGLQLSVQPEALRYLAQNCLVEGSRAGTRQARSLLTGITTMRLVRRLNGDGGDGALVTVTPDDVS